MLRTDAQAVMQRKSITTLVIILTLMLSITGCRNDVDRKYEDKYKEFKQSFLSATEFIEKDKDYRKAILTIDDYQMNKEMQIMKSAYDQMGKLSKTDKEKGIYSNVTIYYKEVEYIIYAKKNLANLAIDEKRELESKVFSMIRDRESILKGEV